jgi:hypothetical protein
MFRGENFFTSDETRTQSSRNDAAEISISEFFVHFYQIVYKKPVFRSGNYLDFTSGHENLRAEMQSSRSSKVVQPEVVSLP